MGNHHSAKRQTLVSHFARIAACLAVFALAPTGRASDTGSVLPSGNTADGADVLISLTSGVWNTGLGFRALYSDTSGGFNTAEGARALFTNTTGSYNTAMGMNTLSSNTSGVSSTAVGYATLQSNTASGNTAFGALAAQHNTTGSILSAFGYRALNSNTTGSSNNAFGWQALASNTTANWNNAFGGDALAFNSTGILNNAFGDAALRGNTTGSRNSAFGDKALTSNNGGDNTGIGTQALYHNTGGFDNTAIGLFALLENTTGNDNVAVGSNAGQNQTDGSGCVYVGASVHGQASESNKTRIRNIGSTPIVNGATVVVASTGGYGDAVLGYNSSSRRYKQDIEPIAAGSNALFSLKPVSYRPKDRPADTKAYGLIAEEVAEINSDLVIYNPEGAPETVRYDSVNAMLLNEFLKEHRQLQRDRAAIAELRSTIAQQQKQLAAFGAQLEKVTARVEVTQSGKATVAKTNN